MARRQTIVRKTKKPRVTKSETYLVNKKWLGDEPSFKGNMNTADYIQALNWYNYMCSISDAREYLETYLKNQARTEDLKKLKMVGDKWISTTAGWAARMISRGLAVPESARNFVESKLVYSFNHISQNDKEENEVEVVQKTSIQQRMREKASDVIAEIEGMIDDLGTFSLYEWLQKNEIPAAYTSMIIAKFAPQLQEHLEALEGKDKQLVEGYSYLTKSQLKERVIFFNSLIEDAERYGTNTKKVRAPRKPRAVSIDKKLKNFKYQKEDNTFKLASVSPEKIVGAQELWAFNTKYKTLTVFRALDRGGLDIKGSSITKYDESTSVAKRTGRKPEVYIEKVLKGGKIVLRKLMDEMKNDASFTHRINENTILLKIT